MSDNKGIKINIGFQKKKNRYGGCLTSEIARTHKYVHVWVWYVDNSGLGPF